MSRNLNPRVAAARRHWSKRDLVQIANLSGQGFSGGEIGEALGTTGAVVRALLFRYGVQSQRRVGHHDLIKIHCTRRDRAKLHAAAFQRDLDPEDLALKVICAVLDEPVLLDNLLDDEEVP